MSLDRYDTTGMIRAGKLRVSHIQRWVEAMRAFPDGPVVISIRPAKATRSLDQNALYWAGYVAPIAEYTGYAPTWIHAYLKKRFLTPNHLVIANTDGVVVDEDDLAPTTTTLTKAQFAEFLHAIEGFALELGVTVGPKDREYALDR